MKNTHKRWFQVEGAYTAFFGFAVQASDAEEAKNLFWKSDIDVEEMEHEVHDVMVLDVTECDAQKR